MNLLVVVLNYRCAGLTVDAVEAAIGQLQEVSPAHIAIVDNASADGSVDRLEAAIRERDWAPSVSLTVAPKNGGFSYGNNQAIRPWLAGPTPPRYVLLLNPDTVARPGAIQRLVGFMDDHPTAGIAGSRLEDPDGTAQRSSFRFPGAASEFERAVQAGPISKALANRIVAPPIVDTATETDWVAGASMIVRREVFDAIGLMDEDYFMYFEETDFCRQARLAGWPCWYVPESRVVHLVGQVSQVTNAAQQKRRLPRYWFESRRRYFTKNHGHFGALLADAAWLTGHFLKLSRGALTRHRYDDPEHIVEDFIENSAWTRGSGR